MTDDMRDAERRLRRVRRTSGWLKHLATLIVLGLAALGIGLALVPQWLEYAVTASYPTIPVATGLTALKRILLMALISVPLGLMLYTLWQIRMLFGAYEQGAIFATEAADDLRRAGIALVAAAPVQIAVRTLSVLVLTYDNPAGQRMLAIELSSDTYLFVLFGSLLIVIGWVMREAAALSEEHRQFV